MTWTSIDQKKRKKKIGSLKEEDIKEGKKDFIEKRRKERLYVYDDEIKQKEK